MIVETVIPASAREHPPETREDERVVVAFQDLKFRIRWITAKGKWLKDEVVSYP